MVMPVQQAFKKGALPGPGQRADFPDLQRKQPAQVCPQRRLRNQHLGGRHPLVTHAIGGNLSARRQRNPAALLQFEQPRPGGHVLELANRVAPVPERGQRLAPAAATPVRMRRQPRANLLQIGRGNVPPLDEVGFMHQPQIGRGGNRSSVRNETVLAPSRPADHLRIRSRRPQISAKQATSITVLSRLQFARNRAVFQARSCSVKSRVSSMIPNSPAAFYVSQLNTVILDGGVPGNRHQASPAAAVRRSFHPSPYRRS
jgi:hypothetical protein